MSEGLCNPEKKPNERIPQPTEGLSHGVIQMHLPQEMMQSPQWEEFKSVLEFGFRSKDRNVQRKALLMSDYLARGTLLLEPSSDPNDVPNYFEINYGAHEIGKLLVYLLDAKYVHDMGGKPIKQSPDYRQYTDHLYNQMTNWARIMNKMAKNNFGVFVPIAGAAFDGIEMSGGTANSLISEVRGWGIRNRSGNVERKAPVN